MLALNICEQLVVAYLDIGDVEAADEYIEVLHKRFKNSARVMRLAGMSFEAKGSLLF